MQSKAKTVAQYLSALPKDRREALKAVRSTILKNLPKGYAEGMQNGAIGYFVPHSIYPPGYHCDPKQPLPFGGLASQKNHMAIYLMCVYSDPELEAWFREAWAKTGKKLDMGKSCVRFKKLDDVALNVIGQVIRRVPVKKFIEFYESAIPAARRSAAKKSAQKRSPSTTAKTTTGKSKKKKKRTAKSTRKISVRRET
ncbi:MAG: DUF1801 domain-containing protein [Planctomycetes bacterium]|nr:DUF1801 domain-containing protein [Planctomycetota bacterium]MCH8968341.1 DUF1801 domain-containing protein [Planctomycetota bacterium]